MSRLGLYPSETQIHRRARNKNCLKLIKIPEMSENKVGEKGQFILLALTLPAKRNSGHSNGGNGGDGGRGGRQTNHRRVYNFSL